MSAEKTTSVRLHNTVRCAMPLERPASSPGLLLECPSAFSQCRSAMVAQSPYDRQTSRHGPGTPTCTHESITALRRQRSAVAFSQRGRCAGPGTYVNGGVALKNMGVRTG